MSHTDSSGTVPRSAAPPANHWHWARLKFSTTPVFLAELLYEAQRAGASAVRFRWHEETQVLEVEDDGAGQRHFMALLLCESPPADEASLIREFPDAIAWLATLCFCARVTVHYEGWALEFDSRAFFADEPLRASHVPPRPGLLLRLQMSTRQQPASAAPAAGNESAAACGWRERVQRCVQGFALPVFFNDEELPRPYALHQSLKFLDTDLGQLYLPAFDSVPPGHLLAAPQLFYQGLPVERSVPRIGEAVLHLAERPGAVRPGERGVLVDAHVHWEQINALIRQQRSVQLLEAHRTLAEQDFVDKYWSLCVSLDFWQPQLIAAAPLAATMLERYVRSVNMLAYDDEPTLVDWDDGEEELAMPSRDALYILPVNCTHNGPGPLVSLFALKLKLPVLNALLPRDHWVLARTVNLPAPGVSVVYELHGAREPATFYGHVIRRVQICERFTLRCEVTAECTLSEELKAALRALPAVDVDDLAVYAAAGDCFIIPVGASNIADLPGQPCAYEDDNKDHHEWDHSDDQKDLASFVASVIANTDVEFLNSILSRLCFDPKRLGNRRLCVHYDASAGRLVAAEL